MQGNHSDVRSPASRSYQFTLRSLLLVMTGAALILPVALSSDMMTLGVPFLACSIVGAVLGSRQFPRMVLYSALGGLVGSWLGIAMNIAYRTSICEFWQEVVTKGRWFVFTSTISSIFFFSQGAVLGWVVWALQVILAKAKARRGRPMAGTQGEEPTQTRTRD